MSWNHSWCAAGLIGVSAECHAGYPTTPFELPHLVLYRQVSDRREQSVQTCSFQLGHCWNTPAASRWQSREERRTMTVQRYNSTTVEQWSLILC